MTQDEFEILLAEVTAEADVQVSTLQLLHGIRGLLHKAQQPLNPAALAALEARLRAGADALAAAVVANTPAAPPAPQAPAPTPVPTPETPATAPADVPAGSTVEPLAPGIVAVNLPPPAGVTPEDPTADPAAPVTIENAGTSEPTS